VLGLTASAGQVGLDPVQFSAASQAPVAARQTVALEMNASAGQLGLVPVQVSSTSHIPAAGRQSVPAGAGACGHVLLIPSH